MSRIGPKLKLPPVPELPRALCRRHPDPDLWFSDKLLDREAARHICRACPELEPCREWALARSAMAEVGIVGGMSVTERIAERRRRRASEPRTVTPEQAEHRRAATERLRAVNARQRAATRADVLAVVTSRPGLPQRVIEQRVGHARDTVRRVLRDLEDNGLITVEDGMRDGSRARLHYPAGSRPAAPPRASTPDDLLAIIASQPGINQTAILKQAGRSICWTRRALRGLEIAGLIVITEGRTGRGQPTRLHYPAANGPAQAGAA